MKKIFTLLLVGLLALSLSLSAFAADAKDTTVDHEQLEGGSAADSNAVDVVIDKSAVEDLEETPVYKVVIQWESLDFTYILSDTQWNPDEHCYPGDWDKTEAKITVTNHSSAEVSVSAAFDEDGSISATTKSVTATLDLEEPAVLASAVGTALEDAPSRDITVSITGSPNDASADFTVGVITITITTDIG